MYNPHFPEFCGFIRTPVYSFYFTLSEHKDEVQSIEIEDRDIELKEIVREDEEDMEIETPSHEEDVCLVPNKNTEPETRPSVVPTVSEFAGTSKVCLSY